MPRKRPGVFKEQNGSWRVNTSVTIKNKKTYISLRGFDTEFEANTAKEDAIKKLLTTTQNDSDKSINETLDEYCSYHKGTLKDSSRYRIKVMLRKYLSKYMLLDLSSFCEYEVLTAFRTELSNLEITTVYKNRVLRTIINFLEYSYKRGLISNTQFGTVNLSLVSFNSNDQIASFKETRIWSKQQFKLFLDIIPRNTRDYVLFALWGQLGSRIGEIRALQVKHIIIIKNRVLIEQQASSKLGIGKTLITTPKTISSIREISISQDMTNLLKDYIGELNLSETDFLFSGSANNTTPLSENSIRMALKKYAIAAGVPEIPTHGLRHSNTTWLLTGDLSLEEIGKVSQRLGHSSKTTTLNTYFHINKKDNINILKSLSFMMD